MPDNIYQMPNQNESNENRRMQAILDNINIIHYACMQIDDLLTYLNIKPITDFFFGKKIFIVCEQKNRQKNTNKCYIQHT